MKILQALVLCLAVSTALLYLYLKTRIVGSISGGSGDSFVVKQYWNGGLDGFITEVAHTDPRRRVTSRTLDADDDRYRMVPLNLDETNRILHVKLSQNRDIRVPY